MATPREHVEEIRRIKFSIGAKEPNPLTEDLHQAVKNLSAELYAKDVHFLMELIQNAEDNEYGEDVAPSLQFVITSKDITGTGAASTLLIFNNEKGFSNRNIESICSVGRSTKKNNRKRGYIGEKGIGFKSVFLITSQPYIFSNGYQIRFDESPCPECNVGYIVPAWVEQNQIISEIKNIYGSNCKLPTTTIVLPLKPDKVKPVKEQLSSVHPELLLFLSKIKKLSIREDTTAGSMSGNTVTSISISSETNFVTRKSIEAESFLLHLSAGETEHGNTDRECGYYMWRQRFPVQPENKVDRRSEIEEYVVTLAFPIGERLVRGQTSPGIYAFLPTEMVTNFPFIIQGDFLLGSSRETILMDCNWNSGILNCAPFAFVNAFISLVKEKENSPISNLPRMFGFLPVKSSSYVLLNSVRETIQSKLMEESIIPCESDSQQRYFHKPQEVGRLMPGFWNLLRMARQNKLCLDNISTHGKYILSSVFDHEKNNEFLNFLKVGFVNDEWYAKCVGSSNLVLGGSEGLYLELLLFVAENWRAFSNTTLLDVPLLKYIGAQSKVSLCRLNDVPKQRVILLCKLSQQVSWMIDWNGEFLGVSNCFFLPKKTQCEIDSHPKRHIIHDWLTKEVKVSDVSLYDYALHLTKLLGDDRKRVIAYAHFLHHSVIKNHLSSSEVKKIAGSSMPLVNNYGKVDVNRKGVLVPANGSCWVQLVVSNPWRSEGYVELGDDYLSSGSYAGVLSRERELLGFLKSYVGVLDVPDLPPPDAEITSFSSLLTKNNAFLLLKWIRNLKRSRSSLPNKFQNCIKSGSWLRVLLGNSASCKPPSQSFLPTSLCESLIQNGSLLVDIPLVDLRFYGKEISDYKDELREVGVMYEFSEACNYIGNHLMTIAASSALTKAHVFSILNFIRFLRNNLLPPTDFINKIKDTRWLRTSQGDRSPLESVLYEKKWKTASEICDIPFIDHKYYGAEISSFCAELELLGVVVGFHENYKLIVDTLKSPCGSRLRAPEAVILMLECMKHLSPPHDKLVRVLKESMLLKTTKKGYKSLSECFLFDPEWGCLLQVFDSFSLVDLQFYGINLSSFKIELKNLGVIVDFEEATKSFTTVFRKQASLSCINKGHVLSFLACYKKLESKFPHDLKNCIKEVEWLRTRLTDYRAPKDCILFCPEWISISSISILPFIDDGNNNYGKGISDFEKELHSMGVVVSFGKGAKFVASSLCLPQDPSSITPAAAYSLLECIRNLQRELNESSIHTLKQRELTESSIHSLKQKASQAWIKTHIGYRYPDKCLLYSSDWVSSFSREDGPFVDDFFYGSNISSYSNELRALGVVVEKGNGCSLLASHLNNLTDSTNIKRIYSYLADMNWKPTEKDVVKIWIPNKGEWVGPDECVFHDRDGLFGQMFYVLDKYYENKLLNFFSSALDVKVHPSFDDYCKIWIDWEDSGHSLSSGECIAFLGFITKHWTRKDLSECFRKIPVSSSSSDDGRILLVDKCDVFIADDLCLKDLFEQSSSRPLFVWYPQTSLQSLPRNRLLDIYGKIGVRFLSESVRKSEESVLDGVSSVRVDPAEVLIGRGLLKLILGFLASLQIEVQKRHEAVKGFLGITVFETSTPITVEYSLLLKSGENVSVHARRLVRWEREKREFYMPKFDRSGHRKDFLECATCFAEVISEGLLWDNAGHIQRLAELIQTGFVFDFDEEVIEFLMKSKNLQIFSEDDELLSAAFPVKEDDFGSAPRKKRL